jgi:hypothetical protein
VSVENQQKSPRHPPEPTEAERQEKYRRFENLVDQAIAAGHIPVVSKPSFAYPEEIAPTKPATPSAS